LVLDNKRGFIFITKYMKPLILDGKKIAKEIKEELAVKIARDIKIYNKNPSLTAIIVGDFEPSKIYVNNKKKACLEVCITSQVLNLKKETTETELINLIHKLNNDKNIHGILVQLPLPDHINSENIIKEISPLKDVDGFHPVNIGKLVTSKSNISHIEPCTPLGIMELFKRYNIELRGKNACVIGRSNIVGKPLAIMLLRENATVTIAHSKTKNLKEITKNADIIIACIGKAKFVNNTFIKQGAIIIDVGINRIDDKITGDVDYDDVITKVSAITPVPGGVGPMTIAMLLENTYKAYNIQESL
jgi:methylenetetrahydrofolate dehydrogenase (NADP+)/methenyltetrahydrofolate cyclohydrolase